MLLLAIDTSAAVTAAVHDGTAVLAAELVHDAPGTTRELLVPMVERVLAAAGAERSQLTGVVAGRGPRPVHRPAGRAGDRSHARSGARRPRARGRQPRRARPAGGRRLPGVRGRDLRRGHGRSPQGGLLGPVRAARRHRGRRSTGRGSTVRPSVPLDALRCARPRRAAARRRPRRAARRPARPRGRRARRRRRASAGRGRRPRLDGAAVPAPPGRRAVPAARRACCRGEPCGRCAGGTCRPCTRWSRGCSTPTSGRWRCSGPSWPPIALVRRGRGRRCRGRLRGAGRRRRRGRRADGAVLTGRAGPRPRPAAARRPRRRGRAPRQRARAAGGAGRQPGRASGCTSARGFERIARAPRYYQPGGVDAHRHAAAARSRGAGRSS